MSSNLDTFGKLFVQVFSFLQNPVLVPTKPSASILKNTVVAQKTLFPIVVIACDLRFAPLPLNQKP